MAYSQPTTINMQMSQSYPSKSPVRRHGWIVAVVLLGHLAAVAGLAQLQPKLLVVPPPKPVQIRWVELTPPPPPPKPLPKLSAPTPPAPVQSKPVEPKVMPIAPKPIQPPPKVAPTIAPVAKPIAPPVERTPEPVVLPAPVVTTPVQTAAVAPVVAPAAPAQPAPVAPKPAATPVAADPTPRTVSVEGVAYKRQPQVEYPEQARRRGDTGTVLIRALIDGNGRVDSVSIEQSSGNRLLDQAAIRAVKRASFHPYRENGATQSVFTLIPIAFTLNED